MNTPVPAYGTTGTFAGIDIKDYHAGAGVSNSGLSLLNQSPYHYYMRRLAEDRPPEPQRQGQLEGNLMHAALLEPHAFSDRYIMEPVDAPKRPDKRQLEAAKPSAKTIEAIEWWRDFGERNAGKTVITVEQYEVAFRQADSIRRIGEVKRALDKGIAESSSYATDPATGLWLRCRPDWEYLATASTSILLDAKSCSDAGAEAFGLQIARKKYHKQQAFYKKTHQLATGKKVGGFIFLAVEATYPYAANAVVLDDAAVTLGEELVERDLATLKRCQELGMWPSYGDGNLTKTSLPKWAMEG